MQVSFNLKDKNYIVVGASSGMGKQIALDLAEAGANVLAIARNVERLQNLKQMYPNNISICIADVMHTKDEEWSNILTSFVEQFGKIHGAVYAAGISRMTSLRMFDASDAKDVMDTCFWGMLFFIKNATKKKYACSGSSFVTFSSTASYIGGKGEIVYSAAKAAVGNAVKSIAKEIATNKQRINSVSPGWVNTNMIKKAEQELGGFFSRETYKLSYPLGLGEPKNVSGMVLFLLSDATSWITGTDVVIDGGFLLGAN